ncbi:MAG: hypothetical protein A3H70_03250 [Candidatus Komeilibacteria bacterium RIFCSPLOWO2_02_FULL_48_11]|uniref:Tim44-like domain-containing protein n=1 Tax=Candidatus Komeilibacteria bacterium RIFCSPLOWO2_02_FULL_48_11 TaxID=1798553 RepID=A0A1G2BR37_9BACT|nr:MAG: hypothetical protein A3H70_03250 [Candidatus Komeilibacteria bacterium RIFCSPLOWO2_02_FULL_48_11]
MGVIIVAVWDFFPGKEASQPQAEGPAADLSFLNEPPTVTGQEFDADNRDVFEQTMGGASGETISPLEQEARSLATFFIERFGTYSSDADFANIDDLQSFMTPAMRGWAERFKKSQPQSQGYSAIVTEVASLATKSFAPLERRAVFDIIANRTESKGGQSEVYRQKATIELAQTSSGAWLVSSLYWGERL